MTDTPAALKALMPAIRARGGDAYAAFAVIAPAWTAMEAELTETQRLLQDPAAVLVSYLRGGINCSSVIADVKAEAEALRAELTRTRKALDDESIEHAEFVLSVEKLQTERDALKAALATARKCTETVQDATAAFDRKMAVVGGCSDGICCVTGPAHGQHTNGGCRCWRDQMKAQQVMVAGRSLRMSLERALSEPLPIMASDLKGDTTHATE